MNKKGSFIVFATMFLVSLLSMMLIFISFSRQESVKGASAGLGLLWCDSVLAEYDLNLYDRYDLFGFYGMPREINRKLDFYAKESFGDKVYVKYEGASSSVEGLSLREMDNFKGQVVEVGKMALAGKLLDKKPKFKFHGDKQRTVSGSGTLMSDLPSNGSSRSVTIAGVADALKGVDSIKSLIKGTGEIYFENEYIERYFKNFSDDKELPKSFLEGEEEYIVCGGDSDDSNERSMKLKLIGIREVFNTMYAMSDPKIRAETLAAAEIITPGPASLITQKVLQAGWALAESYNDYQLLIRGKKVPVYKDSVSWALDLESVITGGIHEIDEGASPDMKKEVPCVDPGNKTGETYEDYLKLMLYLMDEKVKMLRVMDLIQINMRYTCYGDFRIRNYNTGLKAEFSVNGYKVKVKREYFDIE